MAKTDVVVRMLERMGLDVKLGEYLDKYHLDSPDDQRMEMADHINDRRISFTIGELRAARPIIEAKREASNSDQA